MTARIVPDYRQLAPLLDDERSRGRRIALTNGCFDLLHVGHVRLIAESRDLADVLVVALNADEEVRSHKGARRPLMQLAERMEIVAALQGVDFVTSFPERTAHRLLETLRPDLHVKGTDWTPETVPERGVVLAYGGSVVVAGDPKSHSSRVLVERIRTEG